MARHQIDNAARDPMEHFLSSQRGGRAGSEVRRRHRDMRELAKLILDTELLESDELREELIRRGIEPTGAGAILYAQLAKAARGDTEAAKYIRDTSGQKPVDGVVDLDEDQPIDDYDLVGLTDGQLMRLAASRRGEPDACRGKPDAHQAGPDARDEGSGSRPS